MAEAEHAFVRATGASDASILLHSAGAWRRWDHVDAPGSGRSINLPADVATWRLPAPLAGGLFVPIRPGVLAALATAPREGKETESVASTLARALELALTALERKGLAHEDGNELDVMQRVALRILKSHDLQEIFLLITHETRRL
jgi:hypothetical protein